MDEFDTAGVITPRTDLMNERGGGGEGERGRGREGEREKWSYMNQGGS